MRRLAVALVLTAALLPLGCAGDGGGKSKQKKRTVLLTTEYDDVRVGEEASQQVVAQMGLLEDPVLTEYVNRLGHKLLRGVPRRGFQYRFYVVDQTEPNAFALPGGHIFISRGLLVMVNDEDELACVIGHEITHVAHRHAAEQQALARHNGGLLGGFGAAGRMAAYSRDMERDADHGGQILCAAAGYSPMGMSTFLRSLDQLERMQLGHPRGAGFFDSHPASRERTAVNAARASEIRWRRDPSIGDPRRAILAKTEGIPVGPRPETGLFQGSLFLHPTLGFKVRFPRDWRTSNSAQAVGAFAPRGDAIVYLTADLPPGEPQRTAEQWLEKEREGGRVELRASNPVQVGEFPGWRMEIQSFGGGLSVTGVVTFFPFAGATWRIVGIAPSRRAKAQRGNLTLPVRSFATLEPGEADGIVVLRMGVTEATENEALERLSLRTDNAWSVLETAVNNGVFSDHRFERGDLVKTAHAEDDGD
ncbi:MAG: M48 family metalloprotease [Myxococcota bacterium]|nr:M48 family metalloprotease [Myxococcota bacterium]